MATGSDAVYVHLCSPCMFDRLNKEANYYCRNCDETFCDTCVQHHNRVLRRHVLLGRENLELWYSLMPSFSRDHVFCTQASRYVNVRTNENGETCLVNDICVLSDGQVFLVDFNNAEVKMLTKEYVVAKQFRLPMPYCPLSMCLLDHDKSQYAIGLRRKDSRQRKICLVKFENDSIVIRIEFLINHEVAQIRSNDGRLFVSSNSGIYVYSLNGALTKVLLQNEAFPKCSGLEFTDHGRRMHACLTDMKIVKTVDEEGRQLAFWKEKDMANINGVTAHANGTLFVCGHDKEFIVKVTQLSAMSDERMGTVYQHPYTDMLPFRMCYNLYTGDLIVAGKGNNILVLTLK